MSKADVQEKLIHRDRAYKSRINSPFLETAITRAENCKRAAAYINQVIPSSLAAAATVSGFIVVEAGKGTGEHGKKNLGNSVFP
jgi:hypothetical protein